MDPKFNIDRPKISDEEIKKHQDFDKLVRQFKEQSLKKARGDESWRGRKKIRYAAIIAGITVVCTVTYLSISNSKKQNSTAHETLTTPVKEQKHIQPQPGPFIKAPSQKLNIAYSSYKVNSSKGASISHHTGSKIKIPKNAFVDKNGREVQGDVTIEYREFHDLGDIIVSGIPMQYDSAGKKSHFESAGMFQITGKQNGQPVYIQPDKQLSVELASQNNTNHFNQYYLDTVKKGWQYIKHDEPFGTSIKVNNSATSTEKTLAKSPENAKTLALKAQVESVIPRRMDSVKTVYVKKVEKLPNPTEPLKPVKYNKAKPTFVIEGNHEEFPELSAFDNVIFEVGPENKNYSPELHEITWSDLKISQGPSKGKNYLLTLTYRQRKEQLIVYPVLRDGDFTNAQRIYETKLAQYETKKQNRLDEEKRLMAEMEAKQAALLAQQRKQEEELKKERALLLAKYNLKEQQELAQNFGNMSNQTRVTRIFRVANFGVYNSDCARPAPVGPEITPVFVHNGRPVLPHAVYIVCHAYNMVISLDPTNGYRFNYAPGSPYSICVFDKNSFFLCNKTAFDASVSSSRHEFPVEPLSKAADNMVDFKKALEI